MIGKNFDKSTDLVKRYQRFQLELFHKRSFRSVNKSDGIKEYFLKSVIKKVSMTKAPFVKDLDKSFVDGSGRLVYLFSKTIENH